MVQSYSESLSIRRRQLGNDHKDVASLLKDMALVFWNRDMFEEALRYDALTVAIFSGD